MIEAAFLFTSSETYHFRPKSYKKNYKISSFVILKRICQNVYELFRCRYFSKFVCFVPLVVLHFRVLRRGFIQNKRLLVRADFICATGFHGLHIGRVLLEHSTQQLMYKGASRGVLTFWSMPSTVPAEAFWVFGTCGSRAVQSLRIVIWTDCEVVFSIAFMRRLYLFAKGK